MDKLTQAILAAQKPTMTAVVAVERRVEALENNATAKAAEQAGANLLKMADAFSRDSLPVEQLPHIAPGIAVCRAFGAELSAHLPEVA